MGHIAITKTKKPGKSQTFTGSFEACEEWGTKQMLYSNPIVEVIITKVVAKLVRQSSPIITIPFTTAPAVPATESYKPEVEAEFVPYNESDLTDFGFPRDPDNMSRFTDGK